MNVFAVKMNTDVQLSDKKEKSGKGAKVLGLPLCLELDSYMEETVYEIEKQRMVAMFFQQKPLEEVVFGSDDIDEIEVDI